MKKPKTQIEPKQKAEKGVIVTSVTKESVFSGPLPHPDVLRGYEDVQQGLADRIVSMTEKQVDHRIQQENRVVRRSLNIKVFGMVIGSLLTVVILGVVVYLAIQGHDWLAGVLGTTTILGLGHIFVLGTKAHNSQKAEKSVK